MEEGRRQRWTSFLQVLQDAIDGKKKFTLILEDPLAASYLQNVYAPDPDPNMTIEEMERTEEVFKLYNLFLEIRYVTDKFVAKRRSWFERDERLTATCI